MTDTTINQTQIETALQLQAKFPNHLVLIHSGSWLRAFNQSAYVLHKLKQFKLRLAGPIIKPHLIAGFPAANYKQKLWALTNEHQLAYVILKKDKNLEISDEQPSPVMSALPADIVDQVIQDLLAHKKLSAAATAKALTEPDTREFIFKTKACELDNQLLRDIIKLPRDLRVTWGENVRKTMQSIMRNTYLYGQADNKAKLLKLMSADIDLLKHYLCQAPTLSRLKIAFGHRVGLVVELGQLLGGLIRTQKAAS